MDAQQDPFIHITGGGELLKILRTFPSHTANYTCRAVNEAGEDSITFSLDVMGRWARKKARQELHFMIGLVTLKC